MTSGRCIFPGIGSRASSGASGITGIRHRIVHDYMDVDYDVLWEVATRDLPGLIAQLEKIVPAQDAQ